MNTYTAQNLKHPWYYSSWLIIPLLFLFYCLPIGLILMWKGKRYPLWIRWAVTGVFGWVSIIFWVATIISPKTNQRTNADSKPPSAQIVQIQEPAAQKKDEVKEETSDSEIPNNKKENLSIGVSYKKVMNLLDEHFVMEEVNPIDGEQRIMGKGSMGVTSLDIIGDKENLLSASLIVGFPNDDKVKTTEGTAVMIRFLANVVPEWKEASGWAAKAIVELFQTKDFKERSKTIGNKKIIVSGSNFGLMIVTVKHKNNSL